MPDTGRFEPRLAEAIQRWMSEAPTDVDVYQLVRSTRPSTTGARSWPPGAWRALMFLGLLAATVLVIGGSFIIGGPQPRPARVYEERLAPSGSMSTSRIGHSATLLDDGRVLIAGGMGRSGGEPLISAEVYDPTSGRFTPTGKLSEPRARHRSLLLADGRVLLLGGASGSAWAETWDPVTGVFSASEAGPAEPPGSAVRLPDGRVLLAGGVLTEDACVAAGALIYDPSVDRLMSGPPMDPVCTDGWALSVADGRVFVLGMDATGGAILQVYEPESESFSSLETEQPFAANPGTTSTTLLEDGTVLIVDFGGRGPAVWILDLSADRVPSFDDLPLRHATGRPPLSGQPVPLEDGHVLFAGAFAPEVDRTSWLVDPVSGQSHRGPDMGVGRGGATLTRLADGRVLIVGGRDGGDPMAAVAEVFE